MADAQDVFLLTKRVTTSEGVYIRVHDRREEERNAVSEEADKQMGP